MERTKPLEHRELIKQHLKILKRLQYPTGLFAASSKRVGTGYDKSWLRDNFYECLAFEIIGDYDTAKKTYTALLKIFLKHEHKIDIAIEQRPIHKHEYIHARFHPKTFDEFWEDWGNKQNDAVGAILFGVGELYRRAKWKELAENKDYIRILNKLVLYLRSIEFWHDIDSGMWEEDEELHASSVGACVAGLKSIRKVPGIDTVDDDLIEHGMRTLAHLLPRESKRKYVDLAELSLIYPYNVVTQGQRNQIIKNVQYHLERERGVIRYKNDYYYNRNPDGYSEEAEWTFGFSWLAIIFERVIGDEEKAQEYIEKAISTDTRKGMPELYFSQTKKYNENTPLGWSESMFVIALYEMYRKHHKLSKNSFKDLFYS